MMYARPLESTRFRRALLGLLVAALCLGSVQDAEARVLRPPVQLGPIVVLNGTATVTGTVRGTSASTALVTINGRPVTVNLDGTFVAVVDVAGRNGIAIEVGHPLGGERSVVWIPLNAVLLGGIVQSDLLAAIERAAVSIVEPAGRLKIVDGRPTTLLGSIGSSDGLVHVDVNGVDVLQLLDALGRFALPVPAPTQAITIVIVDNRGTTMTTTLPVEHQTSPPAPPVARTVRVAGLRVAGVRYVTKHFRRTRRVRMIVTIKDGAGRPVRGARVQVRAAGNGLRLRPKVKRTGTRGRVAFLLHPRARLSGNRLRIVALATTPTARAKRTTAFRVPRAPARALTRRR